MMELLEDQKLYFWSARSLSWRLKLGQAAGCLLRYVMVVVRSLEYLSFNSKLAMAGKELLVQRHSVADFIDSTFLIGDQDCLDPESVIAQH